MRICLLAAVTVLGGVSFAADPGLLSLAMPEAQAMAGINVEQIKGSAFGQLLLARAGQQPDTGLQKLIDDTGFDPRRDIREILVAGSGGPGAKSAVILIRGTFDVPRIVEAALTNGGAVETYKGTPLVQPNSQQRQALAFPDAGIVIAGDADNVRAAIDRKSAPAEIGSALAAEVSRLSATEDIWFVSMVPPSQLRPQAAETAAQPPSPFSALNKVQQASGGIKFDSGVAVSLRAILPTPQDASGLVEMVNSFLSHIDMLGPQETYRSAAELLKNVNISADGPAVKLSLNLPSAQIEQLLPRPKTQSQPAPPLLR